MLKEEVRIELETHSGGILCTAVLISNTAANTEPCTHLTLITRS